MYFGVTEGAIFQEVTALNDWPTGKSGMGTKIEKKKKTDKTLYFKFQQHGLKWQKNVFKLWWGNPHPTAASMSGHWPSSTNSWLILEEIQVKMQKLMGMLVLWLKTLGHSGEEGVDRVKNWLKPRQLYPHPIDAPCKQSHITDSKIISAESPTNKNTLVWRLKTLVGSSERYFGILGRGLPSFQSSIVPEAPEVTPYPIVAPWI